MKIISNRLKRELYSALVIMMFLALLAVLTRVLA
jgi:hypothetical protein